MPGFDGSGPMGKGPMGRGLGPCRKDQSAWGRGRGFRRGGGFGWRMQKPWMTPEEEINLLERDKRWLETQIEAIVQRISSLEKKEDDA